METTRKSVEPALQNVPIRTALGKQIRDAFAPKSNVLLKADYSAIERRLLEKVNQAPYHVRS